VSDRKFGVSSGGSSLIDHYEPQIVSAQDYYPFGMLQPGRSYNASGYRYGFNGKENDNEVKGEGMQQDYGMRVSDPRLGRFLSVDPITKQYPELTPYQYASNRPNDGIDRDGLEWAPTPEQERTAKAKAALNVIKSISPPQSQQSAAFNLPTPNQNATLSQGAAPGTRAANESAKLKKQYELDKEMQGRSDADPISYGGPGFGQGLVRDEFVQMSASAVCPACGIFVGGYATYVGIQNKDYVLAAKGGLMVLASGVAVYSRFAPQIETYYRTMSTEDYAVM
jgi:RHS repeat-associated protein